MKYYSTFIILVMTFIGLRAQNDPIQLWQAFEYVKDINIKGPSIVLDKYQNVYMITPQLDENPFGGFTLAKYDTLGNLLWKQHYEGPLGHFPGGFTIDDSGNTYICILYGNGFTLYDDTIIIKYNPDGEKVWEVNYGDNFTGNNWTYYTKLDPLGRLIVFGENDNDASPQDNFYFLGAIDTFNGNEIWRTDVAGYYDAQNLKILSDRIEILATQYISGNKYYVISQFDYEGQMIQQHSKPYQGYRIDYNYISESGDVILGNRAYGYNITKINVVGDTLWHYGLPEGDGQVLQKVLSIEEDSFFNVYVTGVRPNSIVGAEALTSKFTSDGILAWQKSYYPVNEGAGTGTSAIAIDNQYVYVIGSSEIDSGKNVMTILIYDRFLGNLLFEINIENQKTFIGQNIIPVNNGLIYVGLSHQNTSMSTYVITGCFQLPGILNSVTPERIGSFVHTFPNPATDNLYIQNIDTGNLNTIEVRDINGRLLQSKGISGSSESIVLSDLPAGIYILTLRGEGIRISKQIIKPE